MEVRGGGGQGVIECGGRGWNKWQGRAGGQSEWGWLERKRLQANPSTV